MNTTEINAAITAANAAGGGRVLIPAGTHLITASSGFDGIVMKSGVTLSGAGQGVTTLRAADGSDTRIISCNGITNIVIEDMTLDGNRLTQTAGVHCIASGTGVDKMTVRRCHIKSGRGYNIGLQGGAITNCVLEDLVFEDSASDAVDFKNIENLNSGNILRRIRVIDFCQDEANSQKAGLDIRGVGTLLEDITVEACAFSNAAVRFRQGETTDPGGLGGHDSIIRRLDVTGDGTSSGTGLYIAARNVQAYDIACRSLRFGAQIIQSSALVQDADFATSCDTGAQISAVSALVGNDVVLRRVALGSGGADVEGSVARAILDQCTAASGTVTIASGVTDTMIVGPAITVSDSGTGTVQYVGSDSSWQTECTNAGLTAAEYRVTATSTAAVICKVLVWVGRRPCWIYRNIATGAALSTAVASVLAHKTSLGASAT